jgi:hypothetical protein
VAPAPSQGARKTADRGLGHRAHRWLGVAMTVRRDLPTRRRAHTFDFECEGLKYICTCSFFETGGLAELFLRCGKSGTAAETGARDAAIVLSLALQFGVPLTAIQHALTRLENGLPAGPVGMALAIIDQEQYA